MKLSFSIAIILSGLYLSSCGSLQLKVGRKEKIRPEFKPMPPKEEGSMPSLTLYNFQSFLDSFESKIEDDGAKLVAQLQDGLRSKLRGFLEQMEDSVIKNASEPIKFESPLFNRLVEQNQVRLKPNDLKYFDEAKLLENALGGLLAVAVNNSVDQLPDPQRLPPIDLLTSVLFYDLGINLSGTGAVADTEEGKFLSSSLSWQVIPEVETQSLRTSSINFEFAKQNGTRELTFSFAVSGPMLAHTAGFQFYMSSSDKNIQVQVQYGYKNKQDQWESLSIDRTIKLTVLSDSKMEWQESILTKDGQREQTATIDLETLIAELL